MLPCIISSSFPYVPPFNNELCLTSPFRRGYFTIKLSWTSLSLSLGAPIKSVFLDIDVLRDSTLERPVLGLCRYSSHTEVSSVVIVYTSVSPRLSTKPLFLSTTSPKNSVVFLKPKTRLS